MKPATKLTQRKLVNNYIKQIIEHLTDVVADDAFAARGGLNGLVKLKDAVESVLDKAQNPHGSESDGTIDEATFNKAASISKAVRDLAVACAFWGST